MKETILGAAIRLPNGRVVSSDKLGIHPLIYEKAISEGLMTEEDVDDSVDGFVTSTGRFVLREEAHKIAVNARTIPKESGGRQALESRRFQSLSRQSTIKK
jgi:hypothetical protein